LNEDSDYYEDPSEVMPLQLLTLKQQEFDEKIIDADTTEITKMAQWGMGQGIDRTLRKGCTEFRPLYIQN
jgi:hypothetical protein